MGQDVRVKHRVRMWIAWFQQLLAEYQRARVSLFSGGMAYFVALSLAPAALAFGAIAGLFIDPQEDRKSTRLNSSH